MLSEKEIQFLRRWEFVRKQESSFLSKLSKGLPVAILFGLPVVLSIALVYFFSPEWYTKISQAASGSSAAILIALFIFILTFSFIRMHFKWEMNEQLYNELKGKEGFPDAANK